MALTDLQQTLTDQISTSGDLTFGAIGTQVPALGLITAQLPPISVFPLTGAHLELTGSGATEALQITGTVDWQLLTPTGVTITVTVDPGDDARYVAGLVYTAPDTAKLAIPGVTWFALGDFLISGQSLPWGQQTELLPAATVSIGTTVLIEGDSSETKIPITIGDDPTGALVVDLDTAGVALPSINDVLAVFGSGSSSFALPSTINDLLSFTIEDLFVAFDPEAGSVSQIGVTIGKTSDAGWSIIPHFFTLDSYTLGLNIIDPLGTAQVGGMVSATGMLGSVDIGVTALHPASGGWQFSGYLGKEDPVHLGDIVAGVASQFGVAMPDVLSSFVFRDFELTFDSTTYDATAGFSLDFDVNGTAVDLTAKAALTHEANTYDVSVDGKLTVGDAVFEVAFSETDSTFTATWSDTEHPLEFGDIARRFGFDAPPIPEQLDLALTRASITYDFSSGALVLTAQSKNYGNAAFVAASGKYFFGLATDHPIVLTDLPLLSSVSTPATKVSIDDIQVVVASSGIDETTATTMNALLKGSGVAVPDGFTTPTTAAVALSMDFTAGGYQQSLSISTADDAQQLGQPAAPRALPAPSGGAGQVASESAPDGTVWYDLQKSFGPVSFQKVGIRYRTSDSTLFVLMNAGLDVSVLTLEVLGLGVGSPLTSFEPKFTIDGVAVTLSAGPLEASGGLMGSLDPVDFYGELVLGFGEFSISALGGYAQYQGSPSFFLYGVLDAPLGGPPYLFLTGVAAGVGFNRKLVIPDVSGVAAFPLVAWADGNGTPAADPTGDIGAQVAAVMSTLSTSGVVAPSVGDYWVAVGVRFTSFEIIDAFALLTVTFGTRFEIDVLGLATLAIPPGVDTPIARVELELLASFSPDTGLLAISAQLTDNSYVLDPAAHLTGGFAFYTWFAGDHEGEFVVSLGGYNPNFTVPDYYPQVPRLGLNWQVVPDELAVQGNLYFALTANAVMAGGQLSATWSSGPISAWFTVWADFLMTFKPFHYMIGAGIDLGASFSIKILFVHVRFTIHLGVGLQIWGPPFAGVATVDLSIISFDIRFGSGDPHQDTTLPWTDFVAQLLPAKPAAPKDGAPRFARALTTGPPSCASDATSDAAVVSISVTQGLVKTLDPSPARPWYLVNAETFQCQVTSLIPFKQTTWLGITRLAPDAMQPHDESGAVIVPNTAFSGGVSGISAADFTPTLTIDVESVEDSLLYGVRVLRNAPKALWETKNFVNGVPQIDPATGLTDATIPDTPGGYVLVPEVPVPDQTLPVALDILEFTTEDKIDFAWSAPTYATTDPFTTQTVADTITAPHVATVRDVTLAALAGQAITVDTTLDVASLADPAGADLMATPVLSLLGEQRGATSPGGAA